MIEVTSAALLASALKVVIHSLQASMNTALNIEDEYCTKH